MCVSIHGMQSDEDAGKGFFLGSRGLAEYSTSLPTKLQHSSLHLDLIQRRKGRAEWTRVRASHKYRAQPARSDADRYPYWTASRAAIATHASRLKAPALSIHAQRSLQNLQLAIVDPLYVAG